jgi:hypothetical protein
LGRYDLEIGSGKRLAGSGAANGYHMIGYDLHPSKGENYEQAFYGAKAIGRGSKTKR